MSLLGRLLGLETTKPPREVIDKARKELDIATRGVEQASERTDEVVASLLTAAEAVELVERELKKK